MSQNQNEYRLPLAICFLLVSGCSQAQNSENPPAVRALEQQGLTIMKEFDAGGGCAPLLRPQATSRLRHTS